MRLPTFYEQNLIPNWGNNLIYIHTPFIFIKLLLMVKRGTACRYPVDTN